MNDPPFLIRALGVVEQPTGREIRGLAVPFNTPATITDATGTFTETIDPSAFSDSIRNRPRVPLRAQHDGRAFPIGSVNGLTETAKGLEIVASIADTVRGNEALQLLEQSVISGLSIGFRPLKTSKRNGVVHIEKADLFEVSLVDLPAYETAQVSSIRSFDARLQALQNPDSRRGSNFELRLRLLQIS